MTLDRDSMLSCWGDPAEFWRHHTTEGDDMKATPGPWEVFDLSDGSTCVLAPTDTPFGSIQVCRLAVGPTQDADARLIAAAPCLLAACERIVAAQDTGDVGDVIRAMDAARAAVAKARGSR